MAALALLYVTAALVALFYLYSKWTYTYWKRRGVPSIKPELFYGNFKDLMKETITSGAQYTRFYREGKSKGCRHLGVHLALVKMYVPIDLELVKNILQKDFGHFVNHGFLNTSEEHDPLSANLFNLENDKWRNLRAKLTPTFTSGKLKMMFQTLADCTVGLEDIFRDHSRIKDPVDVKDVISRFSTDIIGSVAFGLDCNTLKNPNSDFLKYGKRIFDFTFYERMKLLFQLVVPKSVVHFLRMSITNKDVEDFFMKIVDKTVKYREENNIYRKDFLHLLLQLKNKGKLTDDGSITKEEGTETMTMSEFTAQCFIFFAAGFETSATTVTFALLELAQNQNIQDKLREDITTTLERHGGKLTYDAVMEMSYLNKVVNETHRKHPPVTELARMCNKEYRVPDTTVVIEEGTTVQIPVLAIHRDPEYYPEPEKFDPERFSEENKAKRPQFSFLTFGEGPRLCIGARFGVMQSKMAIITAIKNYRISVNDKTKLPIEYDTTAVILAVKGGVWLNFSNIK